MTHVMRLLIALFWLASAPALADRAPLNLLAGPQGNTVTRAMEELATLAHACDLDLTVHHSQGALDNLKAVQKNRYTQFGIVEADVLDYLLTYRPDVPDIDRALTGLRGGMRLFSQELHVVALDEISNLRDLQGRAIAIGDRQSSSFLTATVALEILGVFPSEKRPLPPREALAALLRGEIAALFFVDGAPSALLSDPLAASAGVKLLPVEDPLLTQLYDTGVIRAGSYPFAAEDVPTITVDALLLAYNYRRARNRYHRENCDAEADLAHLLVYGLDRLKAKGHPKWAEVDPTAAPGPLDPASCVARGLARSAPPACLRLRTP